MYFKFSIVLSAALLLSLSLELSGAPAWAHAYPAVSVPNDGATVKESPREMRIQFTEGVELAFSQITVKSAKGEVVSQGKLRQLADDTVAIDLKPLQPGNYNVEWQVLSVDTHITDGVLHFTIAAPVNKRCHARARSYCLGDEFYRSCAVSRPIRRRRFFIAARPSRPRCALSLLLWTRASLLVFLCAALLRPVVSRRKTSARAFLQRESFGAI